MIDEKKKLGGVSLWINSSASYAELIERYVSSGGFEKLPKLFALDTNNKMNRIFAFDLPEVGRIVQKEVSTTREYSFWRRAEKNFKVLYTERGLKSIRMALRLNAAGIRTIEPLAYWTRRTSLFSRKCYYAYLYVFGESFESIWKRGKYNDDCASEVENRLRELGAIARKLHDANLRHCDMDPRNLILTDGASEMTLIDLESVSTSVLPPCRLKRMLDMCSLRRIAMKLNDSERHFFCEGYTASNCDYSVTRVERAMSFWHNRSRGMILHRVQAFFSPDF